MTVMLVRVGGVVFLLVVMALVALRAATVGATGYGTQCVTDVGFDTNTVAYGNVGDVFGRGVPFTLGEETFIPWVKPSVHKSSEVVTDRDLVFAIFEGVNPAAGDKPLNGAPYQQGAVWVSGVYEGGGFPLDPGTGDPETRGDTDKWVTVPVGIWLPAGDYVFVSISVQYEFASSPLRWMAHATDGGVPTPCPQTRRITWSGNQWQAPHVQSLGFVVGTGVEAGPVDSETPAEKYVGLLESVGLAGTPGAKLFWGVVLVAVSIGIALMLGASVYAGLVGLVVHVALSVVGWYPPEVVLGTTILGVISGVLWYTRG